MIHSHTSPWWRWWQMMKSLRRTVWPLSSLLSENKPVFHRIRTFMSCEHPPPGGVCTLWVQTSSFYSVVTWIRHMIPQPVLLPAAAVPTERPKSSRSSLDKSKKSTCRSGCVLPYCLDRYLCLSLSRQFCLHHQNLSVEFHWTLIARPQGTNSIYLLYLFFFCHKLKWLCLFKQQLCHRQHIKATFK